MTTEEKIIKGYVEFELLNGRPPHSVFELAKKIKLDESVFYESFTNLDKVRQAVLTGLLNQTLSVMDADPQYLGFSSREKLLALFFTLFEQFKAQRSYLLVKYSNLLKMPQSMQDWKPFLEGLDARIDAILGEGKETEEIKDRPVIGAHFSKGYKLIFNYLFRVWVNDDSVDFSNTDAAIEKTVNLSFDMMGSTPLDSLLDFGKFAMKTKFF